MKKILYSFLFLSIVFFIGCEDKKEKEEESLPYKDLRVIYLGFEKFECLDQLSVSTCNQYPGTHRTWDCFYRGTEPTWDDYNWWMSNLANKGNNNLNDVDWSSKSTSKVKYIHYYVNDNYIEYEEVGEDQLESLDLNGYEIIDYIVNHEGS